VQRRSKKNCSHDITTAGHSKELVSPEFYPPQSATFLPSVMKMPQRLSSLFTGVTDQDESNHSVAESLKTTGSTTFNDRDDKHSHSARCRDHLISFTIRRKSLFVTGSFPSVTRGRNRISS